MSDRNWSKAVTANCRRSASRTTSLRLRPERAQTLSRRISKSSSSRMVRIDCMYYSVIRNVPCQANPESVCPLRFHKLKPNGERRGTQGTDTLLIHQNTVSFSFNDDSKDLSTWERGAPAPQCLSELLERQSGAGAPRSRERRTSFLQDLVQEDLARRRHSTSS